MKRITLLVLISAIVTVFSCKKDDNANIYMGTAYVGQSIPVNTEYTYVEGVNSKSVSFIDENSYTWSQENEYGDMSMVVPCEYDAISGEFSDTMVAVNGEDTYGAIQYYPTSFCIDDLNKLYLFTFDAQNDTELIFPRVVAEKTVGLEGTIEGTYKSSFKTRNWFSNAEGMAESIIDAELTFTYEAGTFSGTLTAQCIDESDISVPDYDIEIGLLDTTYTIDFNGTWEYNSADNTITETITSPEVIESTYTPYWVSYNDKLYLVTTLTRFYEKNEPEN